MADPTGESTPTPTPEKRVADRPTDRRPDPVVERVEQLRDDIAGKVLLAPVDRFRVFELPDPDGGEPLTIRPGGTLVDQSRADEITKAAAACGVHLHQIQS